MTTEQLKRGRIINEELLKWERLEEHFKGIKKDSSNVKEIQSILTDYNNLMANFNREELATIMIKSLREHTNKEIERLQTEFSQL